MQCDKILWHKGHRTRYTMLHQIMHSLHPSFFHLKTTKQDITLTKNPLDEQQQHSIELCVDNVLQNKSR